MKKLFLILFASLSPLFARIDAVVTIAPMQTFVEKIGAAHVQVDVMVPPGSNPHVYEPRPSQMRQLSRASLYFALGGEFEAVWLPRFRSQHAALRVIDTARGIPMRAMHEDHDHDGDHGDHPDPHVWLSPANVRIIAANVAGALCEADAAHCADFRANLKTFQREIDGTEATIRKILAPLPAHSAFMVFHPSWGYFAQAFALEQIAVEVEGKAPKPSELIDLIKKAKAHGVRAIIAQPEFSDRSARIIAAELKIRVKKLSPLERRWSQTLIDLAHTIAEP